MKKTILTALLALNLTSCGGSSGGSSNVIEPGVYSGAVVYRDYSRSGGECLNWIKQCFQLSQVQISEQYHTDNSSFLIVESNQKSDILGIAPPQSSSIDFNEALATNGSCFSGGNLYQCSGVRKARVDSVSREDRVINYSGEITATCTNDAGSFGCKIEEEGFLQGY